MRRRPLLPAGLVLSTIGALALSGCGADIKVPTFPSFPDTTTPSGSASTATFDFGRGGTTRISQSGSAVVHISDGSNLNHNGPLGCKGHYFLGNYTEHIRYFFRYTARHGWLLIDAGGQEQDLGRPKVVGKTLVWSDRSGQRPVRVVVDCPLPGRHHKAT